MNSIAVEVPRGVGRRRLEDFDRHVSSRIRQRRIMLGLTQQQMAELIGVTYQQAHKYERAVNRVSAGRLYQIALALGVEIDYFFEDADPGKRQQELIPAQRMMLELARNFCIIKNSKHQDAICQLTRALSHRD